MDADYTLEANFGPGGGSPPTITTGSATNITQTSATLNGTLTGLGSASTVTVSFQYGTSPNTYTHETSTQQMSSTGAFAIQASGLSAGITYYYRAKAVGDGTDTGDELSFNTQSAPPGAPVVSAGLWANGFTTATLAGYLNSLGSSGFASLFFDWGLTTGYGNTVAADPPALSSPAYFFADLTGLTPGTTYHFQARAVGNGVGPTGHSDDVEFTTQGDPWLAGWAHRVQITIDETKIDCDLEHFPVMVHSSADCGTNAADMSVIFAEVGANSKRIAVTNAGATTQQYVEVEKWDDASTEAILWVSRSGWSVSGSTNTAMYLYYDNAQSDNTGYVGDVGSTPARNVWDTGFAAVYHMADNPDASNVKDSTGNNNQGGKKASGQPAGVTSPDGNAQQFDGADDYINCGNGSSLDLTGNFTLMMFFKPDATIDSSISSPIHPLRKELAFNWRFVHASDEAPYKGKLDLYSWSNQGAYFTTARNTWTAGQWYCAMFVGDGATGKAYVNGQLDNTRESLPYPYLEDYPSNLYVGSFSGIAAFDGAISEVQISTVARSTAWVKASYCTLIDDLMAFGSPQG